MYPTSGDFLNIGNSSFVLLLIIFSFNPKLLNLDELYVYNVANGNVRKHVHAEFIREKRTSHSKPVIKMDLDGNILEKYTSMSAAAKYNDTKLKCIQRVVDNTRKSHKGFVFKHGV